MILTPRICFVGGMLGQLGSDNAGYLGRRERKNVNVINFRELRRASRRLDHTEKYMIIPPIYLLGGQRFFSLALPATWYLWEVAGGVWRGLEVKYSVLNKVSRFLLRQLSCICHKETVLHNSWQRFTHVRHTEDRLGGKISHCSQ